MKILRKKIYLLVALCILGHSYQLNGQDEAQTSIVEVQGIGKDADGALKSAVYQAVQQAVGAYVNQETVIKNEEVIQDKLLSVAQGFVERYEIISPAAERRDGSTLWEIKIKAVVKKSEVGAALRTAGIMQVQADGSSGWAKQITMLKNQDDAMKLLEDLLPQIPKNLICARIIEDKNIKTRQDLHTGDLLVEVQIEYDTNVEWWKKEAYPALDAALTALCLIEKPPQSVELNAKKVRNHYRINDTEERYDQNFYPPIRIFNPTNKYRTSWIQREYHIPTIRMEEFISISKKTLICNEEIESNTLEFCDSEGLSILKIPVFPGKYDGRGNDIGSGGNRYGYPLSIPILICGGYTSSPAILGGNGILKQMYIMPEFFSHTSENVTAGFNYKPNPILVTYTFKVDPDVLKNTKTLKLLPGHFGVTEKSLSLESSDVTIDAIDSIIKQKNISPPTKSGILESNADDLSISAENTDFFVTTITKNDIQNSKGIQITDPVLILMQDRANVHRFQNPDGDDVDQFFNQADNRAKMRSFLKNGSFPEDVQKSVLSGNGVKLKIRVYINDGKTCVEVSHQLQ